MAGVWRRQFSTSAVRRTVPKTNILTLLPHDAPPPPPYPYPKNYWFKQANHGLYGGSMVQFGNNVSEEFETKTRRRWTPNVVHKWIYSKALDQKVRLKVSTRVLKTIDKVGGLDQYVLGKSPQRLKELGEEGWKLRWVILNTPSIREKAKTDASLQQLMGGHPDSVLSWEAYQAQQQDLNDAREDALGGDEFEVEAVDTQPLPPR